MKTRALFILILCVILTLLAVPAGARPALPDIAGSFLFPLSEMPDTFGNITLPWHETGNQQPDRNLTGSGSQNVELVGQIGGLSWAVAVQGGQAYLGMGSSLVILNASNPTNPTVLGYAVLPGIVYDVAVSGNTAYVADSSTGLRVIDISNPATPQAVGFYNTAGSAWGVAVTLIRRTPVVGLIQTPIGLIRQLKSRSGVWMLITLAGCSLTQRWRKLGRYRHLYHHLDGR